MLWLITDKWLILYICISLSLLTDMVLMYSASLVFSSDTVAVG